MSLPKDRIGDRGQRYEVSGTFRDGSVCKKMSCFYTNDLAVAQRAAKYLRLHPAIVEVSIRDRNPEHP